MIELRNLKKAYRGRTVLDIDSLNIGEDEILALVGANGSGKTTLLRILAGQLKADEGEIFGLGSTLFLPQSCYAFRGSVFENVILGAKTEKQKAVDLLEKAGLAHLKDKRALSLSGGELQRLALCRLLIRPCKLLLLDEPTSACDAEGETLMMDLIEEYRTEHGCAVILSTHTPSVALTRAKRLIILEKGKPEADGEPLSVLKGAKTNWAKQFLLGWSTEC